MPQLDFSTYPSQLFWLFVTFALLYFVIIVFVIPRITKIFEVRSKRITSAINYAKTTKDEALNIKNDFTAKLAHARKTSSLMLAETAKTIKENSMQRIKQREEMLKQLSEIAENEILEFKREASAELHNVVIDSARFACKAFGEIDIKEDVLESFSLKGKKDV